MTVTVTVTGPARFDATVYEGERIPSLVITFRVSGDVTSLTGRTVFVLLEVPDASLFEPSPIVNLSSDGLSGNVQLFGAVVPSGSAATYTDTVRTHVCLDVECASQLRVVNPDVPYTVIVKQGLRVSSVVLETTFGTPPAPLTVPIGLPEGAQSWTVRKDFADSVAGARAEPAPGGAAAIVVSADDLLLPGTVSDGFTVEAVTAEGETLTRGLQVTYTTTSSQVRYAFRRPAVHLTVASGYPYLTGAIHADALFPGGDGDRFDYLGATYTWPASAGGNAFRDHWLYRHLPAELSSPRDPTSTYGIELQAQGCFMGNCLPAGRYEATLHFQYTPASGSSADAYLPVTLEITP